MIALTLEIGPELKALLTPLIVALAALITYRKQSKQFKPNGGSSLRDAVDRIENKVDSVVTRVTALEGNRRASDLPPPPPANTNPTPEA